MLSDRQYMRDREPHHGLSTLTWMIGIIIAGFLLQQACLSWFGLGNYEFPYFHEPLSSLALTPAALLHFKIWTLLTYGLLHNDFWHIFTNLLAIYFFGRAVLSRLGSARFVWFCAAASAVGGLVWVAANHASYAPLIGASSIAVALLILYACFDPDEPFTLLLFFFLPVTVRPKYLAWFVLAVDGTGFLFDELPHLRWSDGIAHSAHLGGALTAWIYYRYLHQPDWARSAAPAAIELPRWLQLRRRPSSPPLVSQVNVSNQVDLRAQVDRILDKINSHGFDAITAEERRILDEAKNLLNRR